MSPRIDRPEPRFPRQWEPLPSLGLTRLRVPSGWLVAWELPLPAPVLEARALRELQVVPSCPTQTVPPPSPPVFILDPKGEWLIEEEAEDEDCPPPPPAW